MIKNHQFHLVDPSPWPLIISFILMNYTSFSVLMMQTKNNIPLILMTMILIWTMMIWWRDIQRESTFQGHHTEQVTFSMKYGMILFIISEILFFFSFFWSFFHHSLTPNQEIGLTWPPTSVESFNPMSIPLLNTIILISSGISVTWSHASMCLNSFNQMKTSMAMTIFMGLIFTIIQMYEYTQASFCINDSVYGSTFFVTTGFHGIHVIIGSMFLMHSLMRMNKLHFSMSHHLGLEMAIWYWHFVDVIWLFLYVTIYWWGK
uniref:Cytochrome c oxidase subunit 3 n=1 Tax=Pachypsylla venusta TaxID=38123 RepID=Q69HD2_PACVE|nr:cytochrome c oxidase subunit III [Pachypsylla venusta]